MLPAESVAFIGKIQSILGDESHCDVLQMEMGSFLDDASLGLSLFLVFKVPEFWFR